MCEFLFYFISGLFKMIIVVVFASLLFITHHWFSDGGLHRAHNTLSTFRNYQANRIQDIPEGEKHDKWIVITSINYPTNDVKKLAEIPGWKMVMVGDTKSPKDWR